MSKDESPAARAPASPEACSLRDEGWPTGRCGAGATRKTPDMPESKRLGFWCFRWCRIRTRCVSPAFSLPFFLGKDIGPVDAHVGSTWLNHFYSHFTLDHFYRDKLSCSEQDMHVAFSTLRYKVSLQKKNNDLFGVRAFYRSLPTQPCREARQQACVLLLNMGTPHPLPLLAAAPNPETGLASQVPTTGPNCRRFQTPRMLEPAPREGIFSSKLFGANLGASDTNGIKESKKARKWEPGTCQSKNCRTTQ